MFDIYNILSDFINKIKFAQNMFLDFLIFNYSNLIFSISRMLLFEGYINNLFLLIFNNLFFIILNFKYYKNIPCIKYIKKLFKSGQKIIKSYKQLSIYSNNIGVILISTNLGIITNKLCKIFGVGGHLVCYVF